jgi:hypothetical protein
VVLAEGETDAGPGAVATSAGTARDASWRLAVIGIAAGGLSGLLGVGGGIVLVPAFLYTFLALGYGGPQIMQVCLATSLATIVFTSQRSVRAHAKKGAVDMDILRGWGPGMALPEGHCTPIAKLQRLPQ